MPESILATADGCGTAEIMRRSGRSKPVVWRWQARYMAEGIAGLTRDKTRKPGKPPLPAATVQRVIDLALGPPAGEVTPLDRPDAGEGGRGRPAIGAAHLEAHHRTAATPSSCRTTRSSPTSSESVRKHQVGLQSFRIMRRIEARRRNASPLRLRFSQSLASLRQRLSQAMVRSTIQRLGNTTNPLA